MGRRLFTLAVRGYPGSPAAFATGVDAQLAEVRAWWSAPALGERALHPHDLGDVTSVEDVEDAVRAAGLRSLTAADVAVVYVTGHGTHGSGGRHYLALPAGGPRGYRTSDLVTAVLGSAAEHALVIVNACFAGELLTELAEFRKDLPPGRRRLRSLAVFATADFDERPRVEEFTQLMAEVREWLATRAEYAGEWLSFDDFAAELDRARHRLAALEPAEVLQVWRAGPAEGPSPCLPNPGYRPPDTAVADARRQVATGAAELDYWLDRASGRVAAGDPGWYFTGRRALTAAVARFLAIGTGLLLVTGAAGTGKSAIVARAVTLSDPEFLANPRYAAAVAAAPVDTVPPPRSVAAAVLARNKSTVEVAEQLVLALGGAPVQTTDATTRVARLREQLADMLSARTGVVVLDGLDEAADPRALAVELVGPLVDSARLVVGVRSATPGPATGPADLLDLLRTTATDITELRTDGPDTRDDIEAYLGALLADRYAADPAELSRLADAVATRVTPSFLDARFAARRLRDSEELLTATTPELLTALNEGTVSLLSQDVADSATPDHPRQALLAVLRASAFSLGGGIPWADIWPAVATAIHGAPVPDGTVARVAGGRLSGYLSRDVEDGRVVHRPVHESLAEVLRVAPERLGARDLPFAWEIHRRIAEALIRLLPATEDLAPHPYLRRHLVGHAVRGGILDDATIPAAFLRWETSGEVRTGLGLPIGSAPGDPTLRAWAAIEPFVADASPSARALSLDVATTIRSGEPGQVTHPPGLRPRWARWQFSGDVLASPPTPVRAVAAMRVGSWEVVVTGESTGTIRLWDALDGREGPTLTGHAGEVWSLAALPGEDGTRLLASGGEDGTVRIWDVVAGHEVGMVNASAGAVWTVRWLRGTDGRVVLASGGEDGVIRVWDPEVRRQTSHLSGHRGSVNGLAPLPHAALLASAGEDGTVRLWDPFAGREVRTLSGHLGAVTSVTAAGDSVVASGGDDGTVRLWHVDGRPLHTLTGHTARVTAVTAVSPPTGSTAVASGSVDGTIRLWDLDGRGPGIVTEHAGETRDLVAVAGAADDEVLASIGEDGIVRVWDLETSDVRRPTAPHALAAAAGVPLPTGPAVATVDDAEVVRLWDAATGAEIGEPRAGYTGGAFSSALVPTDIGVVLAAQGYRGAVRLWNPESGAPVGSPLANSGSMHALTAVPTPDGRTLLATGDYDGTIQLWETDGYAVDPVLGEGLTWFGAISMASTSDGREVFVTGHLDCTVRMWDATTGEPVGDPFTGHTSIIRAAATLAMPDGQVLVATGGDDCTVRLWDLATGTERTRIVVGGPVSGLAATPPPPATSRFLAIVGPAGITTVELLSTED